MSELTYDATDTQDDATVKAGPTPQSGQPEVEPSRSALVAEWCEKLEAGKKKLEPAFKRMRECQQIAKEGAKKDWIDRDNFVVPILTRHINMQVAALYAKNPTGLVKRRKKLDFQIWDGDPAALQQAMMGAQQAIVGATQMGMPPEAGMAAIDPMSMQLLQEVQAAKMQRQQLDKMAQTVEILFEYFLDEQETGYREQFKSLVRRAKVNGVGYTKLGYQREMGIDPDITAQIADARSQLAELETSLKAVEKGDADEESPEVEKIRTLIEDLQTQMEVIIREGPTLSYPRSTAVIFDPACIHLKTFAGAEWIAEEFDMTPERVQKVYGVDVENAYTPQHKDEARKATGEKQKSYVKVWEVQWKTGQQTFAIAKGYKDFLRPPGPPDVKIERFWTIFPLIFNEIEDEDDLIPPSDIWIARHMQREYNSQRQGLREHRLAARPRYMAQKGALSQADRDGIAAALPHSVTEVEALATGLKAQDLIAPFPTFPIDPNTYQVEDTFQDFLRGIGASDAQLGVTGEATATESSIAEQSRMSTLADNVDDLDTMLSQLARAMGQLMFQELDKQSVIEIVGPGAVWPDMPESRTQLQKDLILTIKAGSSGRPNRAAELANMERAMPFLQLLPGLNPTPLVRRYVELLDLDLDEAIVEGQPSIVAINAQLSKPPAPPAPSEDPNQQGGQGADNAEQPAQNEPQAQPAYPAGEPGVVA